MKRRISFYDAARNQAAVHDAPNWFERWFMGMEESDRVIVAVPGCTGGLIWIEDGTGRIVQDGDLIADIMAARDQTRPGRPACTGLTARWCPRCGDCSCEPYPADMNDPSCPLHAISSEHAEVR